MEEELENFNKETTDNGKTGNKFAFKPTITISRKQTRRLTVQVDEEKAVTFEDYVRFVSECFGYEVINGDVMNEILKAHFARDNGFKQWRTKTAAASS